MARSPLRQAQRNAYLISRAAGDLGAAQRGPAVLAKRVARRKATRGLFAVLGEIIRAASK